MWRRRFTRDCRELGITIHGTFILGLPESARDDRGRRSASQGDQSHTIQVSLAAPYPGTELYGTPWPMLAEQPGSFAAGRFVRERS